MVEIFQPGGSGGSGGGVDSVVAGTGISVNNTDPANPVVSTNPSGIDHNSLANLTTGDPHTQYAYLAGRSGGQSLSGGDAANDDLTLQGTTNSTRTTSYVNIQPNGGKVGIGTATPNEQLEITGNLRLPTTTNSTGILYQGSDRAMHFYGTSDTFIGVLAGNFTTTGNNNVGIGYRSLNAVTSGVQNVAIGVDTLLRNTSGQNNVAIGWTALQNNTTGSYNIAIGPANLPSNTTGNDNISVGIDALSKNTSGTRNVGIGLVSMYQNTTGGYNAALGFDAGRDNTTGSYNVYLGAEAGYTGTNSAYSNTIAIGKNSAALASNTMALGGTGSDVVSVIVGGNTTNASAVFQIDSTTKGFLPPRMTTTQRDAISSPTAGLIIYNTSTNKLNVYTTAWEQITSA